MAFRILNTRTHFFLHKSEEAFTARSRKDVRHFQTQEEAEAKRVAMGHPNTVVVVGSDAPLETPLIRER